MRILRRYVAGSFLSAFVLGMLVLSFVTSVGLLVEAARLMIKGIDPGLMLRFLAVSVPESFSLTIPLAGLAGSLLLFNRLSGDGEISAMKACGVDIRGIAAPPAVIGLLLSLLCACTNNEIAPRGHFARRTLKSQVRADTGIKLLEPGRFVTEFPGMAFWFERREGSNVLHNLIIFDHSRAGLSREIRARRATVLVDGNDLRLVMENVRVEPFSEENPDAGTASRLEHVIPDAMKPRQYRRDIDDYCFLELVGRIAEMRRQLASAADGGEAEASGAATFSVEERRLARREAEIEFSKLRTEFHSRLALAMAPFALILVGVALGLQGQRRESTIGVAVSLGIMLLYYLLVIGADSIAKRPELRPHLLVWLPSVVCVLTAALLIRRQR